MSEISENTIDRYNDFYKCYALEDFDRLLKENEELKKSEMSYGAQMRYLKNIIYRLYTDKELTTGQMNTLVQAIDDNDQNFFKLKGE